MQLNEARQWLVRARSDLTLACQDAPGILLEDLCYHAQQVAEKALKGVLVYAQKAGN